nr:acyltransferase [uncultured Roseateles sp.]
MHDRVRSLDLLRFLAAIAVVVYHYGFRGYAADNLTQMPPPDIFDGWAKYGYLGVELFFMISGFVILMTAAKSDLRKFTISRVVRLYPAFWFCCTISAGLAYILAEQKYIVTPSSYFVNMTMFAGLFNVPYVDSVYWTLLIEIRFYLLVAVVLFFKQMRRIEIILGFWLLFVIAAQAGLKPFRYAWILILPDYAPYFVGGAMCYLMYVNGSNAYRVTVFLAAAIVGVLNAVARLPLMEAHYKVQYSSMVVSLLILCSYLVMWCLPLLNRLPLNVRFSALIGGLTYPLYLIHQNVGFMVFDAMYAKVQPGIVLITTLSLVFVVAWLAYAQVERYTSLKLKAVLGNIFQVGGSTAGHHR